MTATGMEEEEEEDEEGEGMCRTVLEERAGWWSWSDRWFIKDIPGR